MKQRVGNWGRYPISEVDFFESDSESELNDFISNSPHLIARGLGRCYGDSALSEHIYSSLHLNKFLSFDAQSGLLFCESGVTFDDILKTFVPKGWFLPVTPGTKFITVAGAIASDIHGKNHHSEGTFSNHVSWFDIMIENGEVKRCSRSENPDLFWASCGGMGLTGIILRAAFILKKVSTSFIRQKNIVCRNLDEVLVKFDETESSTYSVAWIDCLNSGNSLGRSILMCGEHAELEELKSNQKSHPLLVHKDGKLNVPIDFPSFVLNTFTVKAFNFLYYNKGRMAAENSIAHYEPYFYPLDAIQNWNRIYGKRGFTQYQLVIPREGGKEALREILKTIANSGQGSFLAVLKLFGKQEQHNPILFPAQGYTLALDFAINKKLFPLLDRLDEIVNSLNGRVYLTKDVRLSKETFEKMYPETNQLKAVIQKYNPGGKFRSEQSDRLGLTGV